METSRTESLEQIERKRQTLEKLLSITRDIARLRSGLTSITHLDQLNYKLTDEIRLYLELLDAKVINASDPALIELLRSMDHRVTRSLDNLLGKTAFDNTETDEVLPDYPKDLAGEITKFREHTHSAIGIRVLLNRRGLDTPPFKLAVPVNSIKKRIQALRQKEDNYKQQVNMQIEDLLQNVSEVLRESGLPEEMKEHILQVRSTLQEKKQHLADGRDLADLPVTVESVILKSEVPEAPVPAQTVPETPPPAPPDMIQHQDRPRKANGLLKRIYIWINSSWKVSWKDTKYL